MKNLVNKIKSSPKKNIIVIGDIMLDEYIFGQVSRISPEAPVPVLKEDKIEWSLGGAANVALNCKHIGCSVSLIGVINKFDKSGKKILSILEQYGILTDGIVKSDIRRTTCKKRALANNQQLLRIDIEDTFNLSEQENVQLEENINKIVTKDSIILVSDYAKGVLTEEILNKIVFISRERNCMILLDPKGSTFDKYRGVNYLKPNYKEFCQIAQYYNLPMENSIVDNAKQICKFLSLDGIVITLGEKGIQFVSQDNQIFSSACKREVFDLTGAGDTVLAFLALGLSINFPMKQCLKLANHAAAVAVSHLKTYAVSLDELIDRNVDLSEKIFTNWALLKVELDWLKLEKKKIVLTNGCFDILHSGHIYLLKEAKKRGDILVVALNTDESIKQLKGASRPINNQQERANLIAAIGVVDFVVFFSQDNTPKEIIEYLKPDVLVKGGDYKKEDVIGYDILKSYGGKVHIVSYQEGFATTKTIQKIKNQVTI